MINFIKSNRKICIVKYLKYYNIYIIMTNNIFDLNLDYNFPKFNLQHNLKLLEKLYSDEFTLQYKINNKVISFIPFEDLK